MKKIVFIFTAIMLTCLNNKGFTQEVDSDRIGYQFICITDVSNKATYITNVLYCNEMQAEFDIIELVENKIGKKLSLKTDGYAHFDTSETAMSEKREEYIATGNKNEFEVILIDIECKNGILH